MFRKTAGAVLASLFVLVGSSHASTLYFNGFESGTGDWQFSGPGDGSITQTASGGGPLGVTAFDGSSYGTIHEFTDGYLPGYAEGGFSLFGTNGNITAYPGTPFTEQMAVYIDVSTPSPTQPTTAAYWIDTAPSADNPMDANAQYGGEHAFHLIYTGSSVAVNVDGGPTIATITTSGWYTFQSVYSLGATPTSLSVATLNVIAPDGTTVLGSATTVNNEDDEVLESQYLGGPGYIWLPSWQDGFSNGQLAIDDVASYSLATPAATPEPGSILLVGTGMLSVVGAIRRRRLQA